FPRSTPVSRVMPMTRTVWKRAIRAPARCFRASISRWNAISSSSSASARRRSSKARSRRRRSATVMSRQLQNAVDRERQALPAVGFELELFAAARGQPVETRALAEIRRAPLGVDPAFVLEPVERRIERSLIDFEDRPRNLFDPFGDGPP